MNLSSKLYTLLYFYFPIVYLFFLINTFGGELGILDGIITIVIPFLVFFASLSSINNREVNLLFSFFIIYTILTGLNFIDSDFSLYYNDLLNYVIPMFFMFVGLSFHSNPNRLFDSILKYGTVALAIGLILYFTMPGWYQNHLMDLRSSQGKDVDYGMSDDSLLTLFTRIVGIFKNTYGCVYTAVVVLCITAGKLMKDNKTSNLSAMLCLLISTLCILTSGCRGPVLASIIVLIVIVIYLFSHKTSGFVIYLILILIAVSFISDFVLLRSISSFERSFTFEGAIGEREQQWLSVFDNFNSYIFGDGVGAYGHAAYYKTGIAITDNNWMKIFAETGIVGFAYFIFIYIGALIKGYKRKNNKCVELLILVSYGIMMIGANPLSFKNIFAIPFWYCIGSIFNKNKNTHQINSYEKCSHFTLNLQRK